MTAVVKMVSKRVENIEEIKELEYKSLQIFTELGNVSETYMVYHKRQFISGEKNLLTDTKSVILLKLLALCYLLALRFKRYFTSMKDFC